MCRANRGRRSSGGLFATISAYKGACPIDPHSISCGSSLGHTIALLHSGGYDLAGPDCNHSAPEDMRFRVPPVAYFYFLWNHISMSSVIAFDWHWVPCALPLFFIGVANHSFPSWVSGCVFEGRTPPADSVAKSLWKCLRASCQLLLYVVLHNCMLSSIHAVFIYCTHVYFHVHVSACLHDYVHYAHVHLHCRIYSRVRLHMVFHLLFLSHFRVYLVSTVALTLTSTFTSACTLT